MQSASVSFRTEFEGYFLLKVAGESVSSHDFLVLLLEKLDLLVEFVVLVGEGLVDSLLQFELLILLLLDLGHCLLLLALHQVELDVLPANLLLQLVHPLIKCLNVALQLRLPLALAAVDHRLQLFDFLQQVSVFVGLHLLQAPAHFALQLSVQLLLLLQLRVGLSNAVRQFLVVVVEFPLFFLHFCDTLEVGDLHLSEDCVSVCQLLVLGLQYFLKFDHPRHQFPLPLQMTLNLLLHPDHFLLPLPALGDLLLADLQFGFVGLAAFAQLLVQFAFIG